MSVSQDLGSPVGGQNWRGLSGTSKILLGLLALAAIIAVIVMPGFFGLGEKKKEEAKHEESAPVRPFEPDQRTVVASTQNAPGVLGQNVINHGKHLPAPLEIGSYVVARQPTQSPSVARQETSSQPTNQPYGSQGYGQEGMQPIGYSLGQRGTEPPSAPSASSLDGQLSGTTRLAASRATIEQHPDFTISAGSKIPCLPDDAADSSLGGFYVCRVPEWIRGDTLRYKLLPPGTKIFGQIKKGMEQGQERLGIVFTEIQTAGDHLKIPIAAPAADAMGRSGADGDVETFFWDKVGSVALYALIDGLQNAITGGAQAGISGVLGSNGQFTNLNFNSGGQSLAAIALQNKINRPPVLRRDQALPLEVSVGQDLHLYDACVIRMRVNPMACPPA